MTVETTPQTTTPPSGPKKRRPLTRAQRWTAGFAALMTAGLGGYSFMGSYESIKSLADRFQFEYAELVPIGIDGGLLGAVVLDLFTTWIGYPIGLLRMSARFFTAGTVAVNAMAGWNRDAEAFDNVQSITLHVFAPVLLLVIVEAIRHLLLEFVREDKEEVFDTVGFANWFLRPWPAFLVWRRMKINKIGSYMAAQDFELRRLQAIGRLRKMHPGGFGPWSAWRKLAPPDVVYKLKKGYKLPEACDYVESMMGPGTLSRMPAKNRAGTPGEPPAGNGSGTPSESRPRTPSESRPRTPLGNPSGTPLRNGSENPSGTPSASLPSTPLGNGSGKAGNPPSGTPLGNPPARDWGTPDGLTEEELFERRIEIIKAAHGDQIPGINKMRDTLKSVGFGVGAPGATELRNAMYRRAGIPLPAELVGSVNGSHASD